MISTIKIITAILILKEKSHWQLKQNRNDEFKLDLKKKNIDKTDYMDIRVETKKPRYVKTKHN